MLCGQGLRGGHALRLLLGLGLLLGLRGCSGKLHLRSVLLEVCLLLSAWGGHGYRG